MFSKKRCISSVLFLLVSVLCFAQSSVGYVQKTNIPTIYIDTKDQVGITSKTEYVEATMVYISGTDTVRYESMKIRGRGNSTWGLAKKPYRIKFKESTKFLGKGYAKNKSWTLLANHGDKSLLRNAVTSKMGEFLGMPFNPAALFVDLVLNGTYLGNYQVSDQVNVDNKRVEIFEQDYVATEESNITGGYLLEIDGFATSEPVYFRTSKGLLVTVKSPDEDCINDAQKNYIRNYLNDFESHLFAENFTDAVAGYRSMIDSATVVPWYIATELSANVDGFWSTYIYKDKEDPKIYFGPLWDYDIAYNNCNRVGDVTNASMIDKGFGDDLTKVWAKQLIKDAWFNNAVNDAWKIKMKEGLTDNLCLYIDSMAALIDRSQTLNFTKYSIDSRVYNEIYLYSTYAEYIDQLKSFIGEHASYLTTLFNKRVGNISGGDNGDSGDGGDEQPVELQPFELKSSYYYRVYNKGTNMVLDVEEDENGDKKVVMYSPVYGKNTQLWKIEKVGDFYRLINRAENMAFNDPSNGAVNTTLNLAEIAENKTQLWKFVVVNENYNYNIINVSTDLAINNNGGFSNEGNPVIAYYNNDRNSVSNNRQWRIVPEEPIPGYVSDEVKDLLNTTITEAETFLLSLSEWQIGDGIFHYSTDKIEQLRQMINDARNFESTVANDYILKNVKLSEMLAGARKVNIPSPEKRYILKHLNSGYVLDVTSDRVSVKSYDKESLNQHFVIEQSGTEGKYLIKSEGGLYLSFGTENTWDMFGAESVTNMSHSWLTIELFAQYYRIKTRRGLLGTTVNDEDSKVYGDKLEENIGEKAFCDWCIEECDRGIEEKEAKLKQLLADAKSLLNAIPSSWIGNAPMQTSAENVNALKNAISTVENKSYTTAGEYDSAIALLNEAKMNVLRLNKPGNNRFYNLRHCSGFNLSCAEGLTLEEAASDDVEQWFSLIAVEGEMNCYNILCNAGYLSVDDNNMFVISGTPRGVSGRFIATQVGDVEFTLQSVAGLIGVDDEERVIPYASYEKNNSVWTLVDTDVNNETGIAGYEQNVDYAVRYDKARQVIDFVSYDIQELADVDVRIYTVGGRLLYTFKAISKQSLVDIPTGTYIVEWNWAGRTHSVKFSKE